MSVNSLAMNTKSNISGNDAEYGNSNSSIETGKLGNNAVKKAGCSLRIGGVVVASVSSIFLAAVLGAIIAVASGGSAVVGAIAAIIITVFIGTIGALVKMASELLS